MRSLISICAVNAFALVIVITCCHRADAKPFINLFNVAVKTDFTDDGNVLSFVYPKNTYQFQLKFNSQSINEHNFNIGGLFSRIANSFRKRISSFNPFRFATTTTSTTESSLDFSNEEKDDSTSDGGSNSSSSDDNSSNEVKDSSQETGGGVAGNGHEHNGYDYSTPGSVKIENVQVNYLPPSSTPESIYLPPN
jgi:hypothetical protein